MKPLFSGLVRARFLSHASMAICTVMAAASSQRPERDHHSATEAATTTAVAQHKRTTTATDRKDGTMACAVRAFTRLPSLPPTRDGLSLSLTIPPPPPKITNFLGQTSGEKAFRCSRALSLPLSPWRKRGMDGVKHRLCV